MFGKYSLVNQNAATLVAVEAPLVALGALTADDSNFNAQLLLALSLSVIGLWLRNYSRQAFLMASTAQVVLLSLGIISLTHGHYFPASALALWVLPRLLVTARVAASMPPANSVTG
jgi:hypothetical protein